MSVAVLCVALAVTAGGGLWVAVATPSLATDRAPTLRELAEIDGDPDTFTPGEQRKFALLQQVLGTPPLTQPPSTTPALVNFGS